MCAWGWSWWRKHSRIFLPQNPQSHTSTIVHQFLTISLISKLSSLLLSISIPTSEYLASPKLESRFWAAHRKISSVLCYQTTPLSQYNDVPGGSSQKATLFMITINRVTKFIQPPLKMILYVGEFNMYHCSSNSQWAHRVPQNSMNRNPDCYRFVISVYFQPKLTC